MKPLVRPHASRPDSGRDRIDRFRIAAGAACLLALFALGVVSCGKGTSQARPSNDPAKQSGADRIREGDPSQPGAAATVWSYSAMPTPAPEGKPSRLLRSFRFAQRSATLDREATAVILDLISYIKSTPGSKMLVIGFCDPAGEKDGADALGLKRAQAVEFMLNQGGAASDRVVAATFGSTQSKADPADPVAVAKERRGEVWLLE
jgi:outer membrane protein OmpA-like peptidoglycan-associated protein